MPLARCDIMQTDDKRLRKEIFLYMMIKIRFATPDDAAELIAMNREFNEVTDLDIDEVKKDLAADEELVAVADAGKEGLAGFCCVRRYKSFCYKSPVAELTELYVRPEYRHKGLASRMITAQVNALKPMGVSELTAVTGANNAQGKAVYRANGFKEQDVACMTRNL